MNYTAFPSSGRFYKGNLHSHSTISDGAMSPAVLRDTYRARGYDFIAITDHNIYGTHEDLQLSDFIIIPGTELDVSFSPSCHHIVAIGGPDTGFKHGQTFERPRFCGAATAQRMIDGINAANNLALYAHPRWSRVMLSDIASLTGYWGMEVMNWFCEFENHTGDSEMYLEQLWWQGHRFNAVGTDDCHRSELDTDAAYVMVKAESLSVGDIFNALKAGHFYASTGPEIHSITLEGNRLHVSCSPCRAIFMCYYPGEGQRVSNGGAPVTEATYEIPEGSVYVRVQCMDERGMSAWSQPIYF